MALNIDRKTQGDKVVVSSLPQADATTAATLNTILLFNEESYVRRVAQAETNEGEKTGFVEATNVDILGYTAEGQLNADKMTPHHLGWAMRMVMGAPVYSEAAGAGGTKHVFRMSDYPTNPPYFTVAHRKGGGSANSAAADYARYKGMAISQLELAAAKGEFLKLNLTLVGLGLVDDGIVTEELTTTAFSGGAGTVVLTNDPQGASDPIKATKVFVTLDTDDDGLYETVVPVTGYTTAGKIAALTLASVPDGTHPARVTYDRIDTIDTWKDEVNDATGQEEYKLKAANMRLYLNPKIDTSVNEPAIVGGQYGECEIDDFKWTFNWNATASSCWAATNPPDESGTAQQVETGDVVQRLTLNRGIRDWILKQSHDLEAPFGVSIWSRGPEYVSGFRYEVHVHFPYCKILDRRQEANEGKWRDATEVAILKDPGPSAGGKQAGQFTAAVVIQNMVADYDA